MDQNFDFAKLILRSSVELYRGNEKELRKVILDVMKAMRAKGCTFEQITMFFLDHGISLPPGILMASMGLIARETLFALVLAADRRDAQCAKCLLRTLPPEVHPTYSYNDPSTNTKNTGD